MLTAKARNQSNQRISGNSLENKWFQIQLLLIMIIWYLVHRECKILLLKWLRCFPISFSLFQIYQIFASKEENKICICEIFHLMSFHFLLNHQCALEFYLKNCGILIGLCYLRKCLKYMNATFETLI